MNTTQTVNADQLVPGDIVLDENGDREHAAFDVRVDAAAGQVRIWTAVMDQDFGWPRDYTVPVSTPYTVRRGA
jgi:hypothetical protein